MGGGADGLCTQRNLKFGVYFYWHFAQQGVFLAFFGQERIKQLDQQLEETDSSYDQEKIQAGQSCWNLQE